MSSSRSLPNFDNETELLSFIGEAVSEAGAEVFYDDDDHNASIIITVGDGDGGEISYLISSRDVKEQSHKL